MPDARAKAALASLPTLVDAGKACFKMRRTQAKGGSKSTAEGGDFVVAAGVVGALVVAACCGDAESLVVVGLAVSLILI